MNSIYIIEMVSVFLENKNLKYTLNVTIVTWLKGEETLCSPAFNLVFKCRNLLAKK